MPTATIAGTHLCNAYEVTRMNEMIAAGQLEVTPPTVVPWAEALPEAHQAMWDNRTPAPLRGQPRAAAPGRSQPGRTLRGWAARPARTPDRRMAERRSRAASTSRPPAPPPHRPWPRAPGGQGRADHRRGRQHRRDHLATLPRGGRDALMCGRNRRSSRPAARRRLLHVTRRRAATSCAPSTPPTRRRCAPPSMPRWPGTGASTCW
jgi:hypothetical protein